MNTPAPPPPQTTDDGEVLLRLDLRAMKPQTRQDLEAHSHLERTTTAGLLAQRLTRLLAASGITFSPASSRKSSEEFSPSALPNPSP